MTPAPGNYRDRVLEELRQAGAAGLLRRELAAVGIPNIGIGAHIESLRFEGVTILNTVEQLPGSSAVDTRFRLILPEPETQSASPDAAKQVERPTAVKDPLPRERVW